MVLKVARILSIVHEALHHLAPASPSGTHLSLSPLAIRVTCSHCRVAMHALAGLCMCYGPLWNTLLPIAPNSHSSFRPLLIDYLEIILGAFPVSSECHWVPVLFLHCCLTSHPPNLASSNNEYLLSHGLCGSGIQGWLSWVVLDQGVP